MIHMICIVGFSHVHLTFHFYVMANLLLCLMKFIANHLKLIVHIFNFFICYVGVVHNYEKTHDLFILWVKNSNGTMKTYFRRKNGITDDSYLNDPSTSWLCSHLPSNRNRLTPYFYQKFGLGLLVTRNIGLHNPTRVAQHKYGYIL